MKQVMKKLSMIVAAFALFAVTALVPVVSASAADPVCKTSSGETVKTITNGVDCSHGTDTPTELFGTDSIFTTIVNILLFIIGAVSVIMLIWGGIRYTTSAGNSTAVTSAKNTIMYAIIGLIIAFLAFAIVNWVLGSIGTAS